MGLLFVVAAIAVLSVPVCTVYLLISHASLKEKVRQLEKHLRDQTPTDAAPETQSRRDLGAPPPDKPFDPVNPPIPQQAESPRAAPPPDPKPPSDPSSPPPAVVLTPARVAALTAWMRENWFFAVAGLSLALAGVFLVQYGIETGLLTPTARVMAALALGAVLIAAAEWIRRRGGDADGELTAFVPSTFAGAGLISIWAGILSARQLYGLIGPEVAFAGLGASAALAVLLGWYYGPLLAAIGILGALAAPFLVGGTAEDPVWLFGYFALIAVVGLAIDAGRRWAWVSTLTLVGGFCAAAVLYLGIGGAVWYMSFAVATVVASAAVPLWSLTPRHQGAMIGETLVQGLLRHKPLIWPEFPTRLVGGTVLAATAVAIQVLQAGPEGLWIATGGLAVLGLLTLLWMAPARALTDMAILPATGFLGLIVWAAISNAPGFAAYRRWVPPDPETDPPLTAAILLAGAVTATALAALRGLRGAPYPAVWTAGAALLAPLSAIGLELFWTPGALLGQGNWALMVMGVAALMTLLAQQHARVTENRALRIALLILGALSMISLALFLTLSKDPLTVALSITILAAALLDRRFDLPVLGAYVQAGCAVILYRALADPGIFWAFDTSLGQLLLSHLGPLVVLALTWISLRQRARLRVQVSVESTMWVLGTVLVCVLLERLDGRLTDHALISLLGSALMLSALGQLYRLKIRGVWRVPRIVLACGFGLLSVLCFVALYTYGNPLTHETVAGVWLINSLLVAFGLPGLVLLVAARWLGHLPLWLRRGFLILGCGFATTYVILAIRHIWRGPDISLPGLGDGELYSYTLALLLTAAVLLMAAWARRAPMLRRLAILTVGIAIAKVFLVDMSGLTGLIRVFSFLALGLSLAGLALVNRWLTQALEAPDKPLDEGQT